jgi:hypothetical protein
MRDLTSSLSLSWSFFSDGINELLAVGSWSTSSSCELSSTSDESGVRSLSELFVGWGDGSEMSSESYNMIRGIGGCLFMTDGKWCSTRLSCRDGDASPALNYGNRDDKCRCAEANTGMAYSD